VRRRHLLLHAGLLGLLPQAQGTPSTGLMSFPRDFGAHPETRLEWWYLTGLLGAAGQPPQFGYQLTFFRIKGPAAADHPSRLAARQLMLGHAALSDLSAGKLRHDQRLARAVPGLAETSARDCDVHLRDWSLRREATGYVARLPAAGFTLDLRLRTTQPVLLQGEQGLSRKGPSPEQFSHYYSQVQLRTEASLDVDGRRLQLLGRSWLDHEWSDALLGNPGADQAVGWDWLGVNLEDGGALTVFRLRRANGSVLWRGGSWRHADGITTVPFEPGQVEMRPLRHWRSPVTGASYPVEWSLRTPLGQHRLRPLIDAQEIDARQSTGFSYWEGAAALSSEDGQRIGSGYLELTGYAGRVPGV